MPFKSEKQRRYMWAKEPAIAKRWTEKYGSKPKKKGGVIKDLNIHERICNDYKEWFTSKCKLKVMGITPSPIKGPKGNIEFLICAKR